MANLSTPGPKELYVRFNAQSSQIFFVGTCVSAPEPEETPQFLEVFADYGTPATPFDTIWAGKTALIPVVVNRVNLSVCRMIRDQPNHTGGFATVGVEDVFARGSFMVGKLDFQLIIANTFFPTVNANPPNPTQMSPGRKYFAVSLEAYKESTVGTRVEEIAMVFKANNLYQGPIFNGTDSIFKLYTEDPNDPDFATTPSVNGFGITPNINGQFIRLIPN